MNSQSKRKAVLKNGLIAALIGSTIGVAYLANNQHQQKLLVTQKAKDHGEFLHREMNASFERIEDNLLKITQYEEALDARLNQDSEYSVDAEERILGEIGKIDQLMEDNYYMMESLSEELDASNEEILEYREKIHHLDKRLANYKSKAEDLINENKFLGHSLSQAKESTTKLKSEVNTRMLELERQKLAMNDKNDVIQIQEKEIATYKSEMNAAYFVAGSVNELVDLNIVDKEGGFIGLRSTPVLNDNISSKDFSKIDKRYTSVIPIYSKKAELISAHHADSYEFIEDDNEVTHLYISDPDLFWETTDYLVISVRDKFSLGLSAK